MMKREKRRAPPTAIAVSVNSLSDVDCFTLVVEFEIDSVDRMLCCDDVHCALPPNEDIHEAAKDEDKEAGVQGSAYVGEVPLGLKKDYTRIVLVF